ncbi:uncharacterized protein LOC143282104 isoform X3 [Babylonia areolata]|uniref:uncharacterized protein LOC143282104 isoform X3 n=1 Tax=Babylonia areolata TaxID=304850 RepID=UPI003FD3270C
MLELCRIYKARQSMYRQERMEAEQGQQQILTKLGELPIVSDTYTQVLDLYQRAKGHNFLFRNTLGLAEFTAKAVAGKTVPIVYNGLQSHIDKVNDMACHQLEALEEKYPIIAKPTEEVLREGQEQYNSKVKPYVDPLVKPAKMAVDAGKTAINVGTTVATTAMKPAVYAVNMGTAVTSSVIDTGKQAVGHVATGVLTTGQKVVDVGLSTPLGQFWMQQFDSALDATEKLVLNYYLPVQDGADGEKRDVAEEAGSRTDRVCALMRHIHNALYHKAEGDMVRYRMMAGNLMHEIMELTGFYLTLMKDGTNMAWKDRKDVLEAFDRIWNKYVQYIPEAARPEDPMKRMVVVLGTLTSKVGDLFAHSAELRKLVNQHLSDKCQDFVHWCQQSRGFLKEGGQDLKEKSSEYISQLTAYIPHIMEMVQFLSDKIIDSLDIFSIDIPAVLNEAELCDVGMGSCQGMGVQRPPPVLNCVN